MKDFFKYLTAGQDDLRWGMYLTVAGKAEIPAGRDYPLAEHGHPAGYNFDWTKGRVLNEYQLHYFTGGSGLLENSFGRFRIVPGTIMITYPGVWHRFRPLKRTGWVENYIGFQGELADNFFSGPWFSKEKPLIRCDIREELIDSYYKIFHLVQEEIPHFQFISSGMLIKLLGYIVSMQTQQVFIGKHIHSVVEEVRFMLRQNIGKAVDFQQVAAEHNIGYSYFRRMFKKYTGISPGQYHLQLKILRAKELLLSSDLTVKEISYELGFQSIYYFSRVFRDKTGKSPTELRKNRS